MKLLHVEVSPRADSASRTVSEHLVKTMKASHPETVVTSRDLATRPIPHLNASMIEAYFTPSPQRTFEQQRAIKLSDELTDELLEADTLVISSPIWNFGMPSVLKAWIDHVVRAGRTFTFTSEGPHGLAAGKKAFIVVSSGSVFSEGPFAEFDQFTPALKTALKFIGITDVEIIRVEGTNNPKHAQTAIPAAKAQIESLVA